MTDPITQPMTQASTVAQRAADSEQAFLVEALNALPLYIEHCECSDRWHTMWAATKATGARRGLHGEGNFLAVLLAPYRKAASRVMIAGAADTGSLDVLHAALGDSRTHFEVIDRCEAPLRLVRQRAQKLGLNLHAQHQQLETVRSAEPWDMVFIHNTLGFMAAPERMQFLQNLRHDMAPTGVIVCTVRNRPTEDESQLAAQLASAIETAQADLARTFAQYPDLLATLSRELPAFASSRQQRQHHAPKFEQLMREFDAAGFELLESHRNPGDNADGAPSTSAQGKVARWISLLAVKRG